jgi:hypothetical protein
MHIFTPSEEAVPAVPTKYNRGGASSAAEGPVPELAAKMQKAGVSFAIEGNTYAFRDPKTADAGIAMLPSDATYIGPDGKTYKRGGGK